MTVEQWLERLSAVSAAERERILLQLESTEPSMSALLREFFVVEAESAPVLEPGLELGRYILEAPLGIGGSATVWRARDTVLGASKALKIFENRDHATEDLRGVLEEAAKTFQLRHPNVVTVFTFDKTEHFSLIEMELCAGSLATMPTNSPSVVAGWVAQAARGVAHAHRKGVLHRDIKPANFLMDEQSGQVKVADFGLSVKAAPILSKETGIEQTCTTRYLDRDVVGTPAYMSPNQAVGGAPSESDDIYGLGACLYRLLTGYNPYLAHPGHPRPAEDILEKVRFDAPVSIRVLEQGLDERLVSIVERAMARDPADRYETADQLADDLEHFIAGDTVSIDPPRRRFRYWAWEHRFSGSIIIALLVFFGVNDHVTSEALTQVKTELAEVTLKLDHQNQAHQKNLEQVHRESSDFEKAAAKCEDESDKLVILGLVEGEKHQGTKRDYEREISSLNKNIEGKDGKIRDLKAEVEQKGREISSLATSHEKVLAEKDREIGELKTTKANQTERISSLEGDLKSQKRESEAELEKQKRASEAALAAERERSADLEAQLKECLASEPTGEPEGSPDTTSAPGLEPAEPEILPSGEQNSDEVRLEGVQEGASLLSEEE